MVGIAATVVSNCLFGLDPTVVVVVDYCGLLPIIAACTAVVGF